MQHVGQHLRLKDFRLVLAIAETGQLALAAEQLSLTQPTASRMLAGIERLVGAKVFNRHPKGMTVTHIGEILARNATNLLHSLEETEREVRVARSGFAGTARIGAVTGAAVGLVVPAIQQLKHVAKGADFRVDVGPSGTLVEGLMRGEYDFVLSRIPREVDTRQFTIHPGHEEIVQFLVRREHPLANKREVATCDLNGFEWVIQAPDTPMRQAVEQNFVENGVPLPEEIVNTTSLLVVIAYLGSTNAIAPVSQEVAGLLAGPSASHGLVALQLMTPVVIGPYHMVSLRNREMSPLAANLRRLVADFMARRAV